MNIPIDVLNRDKYIYQIQPFIRKNLIKVLTGQRRVGKSYLVFQIINNIIEQDRDANIIYINKEDLQFDFIQNASDLNDYILLKVKPDLYNYIFIDEIQDITDFEKALRSLLLDQNNDIYITGSNAKLLSGELATYLSGRYIEFTIYSLSYSEFLLFHKLKNSDKNMEYYFKYGGLPYLINLTLNEQAFEYLNSIYTTILFRDVVSRYNLRNTNFLEKLVLFLADNIGSLFSAKKISDFLKSQQTNIAPNQIQTYTKYLVNAYIIHEIDRYDIIGKRIFETGSKFYFENTGIRNAIIGYRPQDVGKLLENVVYNHLLYLGYKIKVGTVNTKEIDFIGERKGEFIYIQVALKLEDEATIKREFENLLQIDNNYPKYVITNSQFNGNTYQGIQHVYIRDFLMWEN
ncbi:ATP-binding protein [Pedobacter sp. MR2016-19]|uniref:ATP-binding protein n=1 Tax=Pedobacter sp. MR2016-19 TaxID=2780089 RepID=UPI0018743234|nr:ATP-binding protein [Pedobacter sp. MR2016-19]MBE5319123.1 ATP-binding protein [Pedobacter sp. MR2016-19]